MSFYNTVRMKLGFSVLLVVSLFLMFFIGCRSQSTGDIDAKPAETAALAKLSALSQALWTQLDSYNILDIPDADHWFLACGTDCQYKKTGQPLLEAWLGFRIAPADVYRLHRGEFTATMAELDAKPESKIKFSDFTIMTIQDFLAFERRSFSLTQTKPWNSREERGGKEFGWLLKSFCHYVGPEGRINEQFTVPDVIEALMKDGINRKIELGTHELEGLGHCLQNYMEVSPTQDSQTYAKLRTFLGHEITSALAQMQANGLVYKGTEGFGPCEENDSTCYLMRDLRSQGHFLEWATLVPDFYQQSQKQAVLNQFAELMRKAQGISADWVKKNQMNTGWCISTLTHAIHAVKKLQKYM